MDVNTPVLHLPSGRSGITRAPRPGRDVEADRIRVEWDDTKPVRSSILSIDMLEERPHPPCWQCLNPLKYDAALDIWLHQDSTPETMTHTPHVRPWPTA